MLAGARSVAGATEWRSDHYQFDYVMFQVARGPLRERAVREAIVAGVDRDGIEDRVRGALHRPGDGDRLPGQFAYDPSIREAAYDPTRAARLLDAAGWRVQHGVRVRGGVPLALDIVGAAGSAGSERLDVQLQAALAKLGIRSQIKNYQYNLLFAPASEGGIFAERPIRSDVLRLATRRRRGPFVSFPLRHAAAERRELRPDLRPGDRPRRGA